MTIQPSFKPASPHFSSGPCKKPPGFNEFKDTHKVLGRSHRAKPCKDLINKCMEDTLRILGCPEGYKAGILPGSDTGAVEMILWSILGERPVDVFHWETFGSTWAKDLQTLDVKHNSYKADYGELPDLSKVSKENDILFPWNGTTSGVRIPNGDWIPDDREGVTICDATSALFSMEMPWEKLDITTFSWQKALGGEAAHGVVILSPKGLERIRSTSPRPLPKCLSIAGKTIDDICAGNVINTISMMCVSDYSKCLEWVSTSGGLPAMINRTNKSFQIISDFVDNNSFLSFLCKDPPLRSTTSVCLTYDGTAEKLYSILSCLEKTHVAYDIKHYRDAPVGIRIWCGATIEADDISKLLQCIKHLHEGGSDIGDCSPPKCPNFGSGPCTKPPGFNWYYDSSKVLGRSHRAAVCKNLINYSMEQTLQVLGCPEGYKAGILPGSDTGAVEMILWSILGERPVDVFHWEAFGSTWAKDLQTLDVKHNSYKADYGELPDLSKVSKENDILFPWNGTTSGVRIPNGDWIPDDREGVTICDATSALFSMEMPWEKLDITTFSWQKALGGEAAHGVVILSPKGLERIRSAVVNRPLPKVLKLNGKVIDEVCAGNVINTISMMCVQDYVNCLRWVKSIGGLSSTIARTNANFAAVKKFTDRVSWLSFLSKNEESCSTTSVCLTSTLTPDQITAMLKILSQNDVAYDIASYRSAPTGIRIWCGATIDTQDVCMLLEWLEVCYLFTNFSFFF